MNIKYTAPRGTQDILPPDSDIYQFIAETARKIFALYNYQEIQTPVFEHTNLFVRGMGETTDVVTKEMYIFQDKKGRSLSLRPEGTAGVIRSYLENNLGAHSSLVKLFYLGPMFRYERPQAGRLRQHTQIGAECIGSNSPLVDVEIISLLNDFIQAIGIQNVSLLINSIGDTQCRPQYKEELKTYLQHNLANLCGDCRERIEKNPLRILDCKIETCKEIVKKAPVMADYLCADCKNHFEIIQQTLTDLKITYQIAPFLVRGLDYYTRTVFEFQVAELGSQNTIGGGGRYDNLVEELGGPATPALGFGSGMERLVLTLQNQKVVIPTLSRHPIGLIALGEACIRKTVILGEILRQKNIPVEMDYRFGSFKSQLKYADKIGASHVLILGENELQKNSIILKEMKTGEQQEIPQDSMVSRLIEIDK